MLFVLLGEGSSLMISTVLPLDEPSHSAQNSSNVVDDNLAQAEGFNSSLPRRGGSLTAIAKLSTPFHNYNHVCGGGFLPRRAASDAHT